MQIGHKLRWNLRCKRKRSPLMKQAYHTYFPWAFISTIYAGTSVTCLNIGGLVNSGALGPLYIVVGSVEAMWTQISRPNSSTLIDGMMYTFPSRATKECSLLMSGGRGANTRPCRGSSNARPWYTRPSRWGFLEPIRNDREILLPCYKSVKSGSRNIHTHRTTRCFHRIPSMMHLGYVMGLLSVQYPVLALQTEMLHQHLEIGCQYTSTNL